MEIDLLGEKHKVNTSFHIGIILIIVAALFLVDYFLRLLGINLDVADQLIHYQQGKISSTWVNRIDIINAVLDWVNFSMGVFVGAAAAFYYGIRKELHIGILANTFVAISIINLFHFLTTEQLVSSNPLSESLTSFTWWENRVFMSGALILAFILWQIGEVSRTIYKNVYVLFCFALMVTWAGYFIYLGMQPDLILNNLVRDGFFKRPLELIPLALFIIYLPITVLLFRAKPSYFTYSLILFTIPNIIAEIYVVFAPYNQFFTALSFAHVLEILAFAITIIGIASDNYFVYRFVEFFKNRYDIAQEAKRHFVSTVSYQMRSPISSIIGFSDMLLKEKEGPLNEIQKSSIQNISSSSQKIHTLIEELIDIANLDSESFPISLQEVSINEVVGEMMHLFEPIAKEKHLEFSYTLLSQDQKIVTDAQRLHQILYHVIENALRFTLEGSVHVHVTITGDTLQMTIQDSGIGIPEEDLEFVYEPFFQSKHSSAMNNQGLGLGLCVAKKLIDLMKGFITLQSEPMHGTTVTLQLPLKPKES